MAAKFEMRCLVLAVFSLALVACDPLIETPFGAIEGFTHTTNSGKDVNVFLGIRYAKAPDHIFRFEKPEPVDKWHPLTHQATRFRAACIPFHRAALLRENYSEDCLFLNIVTPDVKPKKLLPVLVFIHGGAYEIGDSELYGYKMASENFVSKDIVFVSLQYRLGPLGFFTTGDNVISGNMGLWDQTLALQFLHEMLPSFGGDPDHITLSGHSAGSASVGALMFSPHSDHLFNQAIELSGSTFAEFAMSEMVVKESRDLADAVGCKMTNSIQLHDCMKERTVDEILDGVEAIGSTRRHTNFIKFQPHFDKDFFPYEMEKMARKAPRKKTMQGVTDMESGLFGLIEGMEWLNGEITVPQSKWASFSREDLIDYITVAVAPESEFGHKMGPFLQLLIDFYVDGEAPSEPDSQFYLQRYIELMSDLIFHVPIFHEVDLKRMNGWETYYYVIDHVRNVWSNGTLPVPGAFHCAELRFMLEFIGQDKITLTPKDENFKKDFLGAMVNFIRNGNPSTSSLKWKPVSAEKPTEHMRFNDKSAMKDTFRQEALYFWLKTVPEAIGTEILRKGRLPASHAHVQHTEL